MHHRQRDYCDANLLNVGKQQRFSLQKVTHTVLHFLTYTKDSWLWLSFLALPHNYQTSFGGFPESCCISPLKAQLCGLRNRVRSIKFNPWSRRRLRRPKMVNVWELLARRNFNLFPNSGKRCLIFKRDYKLFNRTTVFQVNFESQRHIHNVMLDKNHKKGRERYKWQKKKYIYIYIYIYK